MIFKEWPKIPREVGETITITEKMNGTNACVVVEDGVVIGCQSRKRIITPEDDNYGFAKWVSQHPELSLLGDGYHYGEWVGTGINKNKHNLTSKIFCLFNTHRWSPEDVFPYCCSVVPVLYEGADQGMISEIMSTLEAKEQYYEGVVVWYHKTRRYAKYIIEGAK